VSDGLVSLGRAPQASAPSRAVALPFTVELPTRYYGRLAVGETLREFAALADVELKVEEGVLRLTFTRVDGDTDNVVDELLNHALYASSVAGPELLR
jgi:hypothetical protein